jgi:hypothetical protein
MMSATGIWKVALEGIGLKNEHSRNQDCVLLTAAVSLPSTVACDKELIKHWLYE